MSINLLLEISATLLGLLFVYGAVHRYRWCWWPGIASSLIIIYVLIDVNLYAEAGLNIFYVIMGIYGLIQWSQISEDGSSAPRVVTRSILYHIVVIATGLGLSGLLAWGLGRYTDAQRAVIDSFTTVFGILATYLEAQMIFACWIYWIVINVVSTWLFVDRGLTIYALLYLVYLGASVWGLMEWKRSLR